MQLPFQDSRFRGSCFSLGYVPRLLKGDRKGGVGKRIVRGQSSQCQRRRNRLLQMPGITQCADQTVMCFEVFRIFGDRRTKALDCAGRIAGPELIESLPDMVFCRNLVRFRHHIL